MSGRRIIRPRSQVPRSSNTRLAATAPSRCWTAKERDWETAAHHFALAGEAIANEGAALEDYVVCLARLQRSAEAVPVLPGPPSAKAIVLAPANVRFYVDFASLCLTHKSYDARIAIDAGLAHAPQAAELYLARGVLHVQVGPTTGRMPTSRPRNGWTRGRRTAPFALALSQVQQSDFNKALARVREIRAHSQAARSLKRQRKPHPAPWRCGRISCVRATCSAASTSQPAIRTARSRNAVWRCAPTPTTPLRSIA